MEYILSEKQKGCVFCDALDKPDGAENLVIYRSEYSFVILNRYPYTSGHLMIVPYLHKPNLEELSTEIRSEIIELSTSATRVLKMVYQPQGFNLGVNVGEVAGAGIQDHVHLHVVPRWSGDTNFMSALSSTRLLPELLQDTYIRVKEGWESNA
jgi:ATP adenylyltransferase